MNTTERRDMNFGRMKRNALLLQVGGVGRSTSGRLLPKERKNGAGAEMKAYAAMATQKTNLPTMMPTGIQELGYVHRLQRLDQALRSQR